MNSRTLTDPSSLLLATFLFLGCGQQDPGTSPEGGGGQGPTPSPAGGMAGEGAGGNVNVPTEVDYFPLVDGSSYVYLHSEGWLETLTVSSTNYEGSPAFLVSETPDPDGERAESVYVRSGTKVLRVYKEVFDTTANDMVTSQTEYRPGFLRADNAWSMATPNVEMEESYERTETEPGSAPKPTEARSHVFVLEGIEEVVTNAGRFADCLRVRRQRTWETDLGTDEGQAKRFWFAPGVGKVREETLDSGNTESLESYTLP
jgi:hypothetical protein